MANYAIGDIQGCYKALQALLKKIKFNPQQDQLWLVGDLVNRGPQSLAVLYFLQQLDNSAHIVLGNHDLHLLSVAYGMKPYQAKDTFKDVLDAPDCEQLCDWLRQQKLLIHHPELDFTLVHAGIPPQWDLSQALSYASEVEYVLQHGDYKKFLKHSYGNKPLQWDESLSGWKRLRLICTYFTRMRLCTAAGKLDLKHKNSPPKTPQQYAAWFSWPQRKMRGHKILFGHWASLQGDTNNTPNVFALDTGCIWGDCLSALRLEDRRYFRIDC